MYKFSKIIQDMKCVNLYYIYGKQNMDKTY